MKTTVKVQSDVFVTVEPSALGGVRLRMNFESTQLTASLTTDQAGALIFGLEQALETLDVARAGASA